MLKYIIRRTLYVIPVVFGVTLITFILFNLVGGNPVYQKLGKHPSATDIQIITHDLGLDRSLPEQYVFYLKQCITLDFGRSWATNQTITSMVAAGIGPSLSLSVPAFTVSVFLSIFISLALLFFRHSIIDKLVVVFCLAGMSISILVYIIISQYFFSYKMGLFPISGYDASWDGRWQYLILPQIIWIVVSLGGEILLYRTVLLDEIFQDYVRTARSKGVRERMVLFKHVLKNAMIPIITNVVLEIPSLIMGSLVLEAFFGIPGLGGMVAQALSSSDFPVIKAMTYLGSVMYVLFNLISDICYGLVDPRVKLE